jgi:hypothetical protein
MTAISADAGGGCTRGGLEPQDAAALEEEDDDDDPDPDPDDPAPDPDDPAPDPDDPAPDPDDPAPDPDDPAPDPGDEESLLPVEPESLEEDFAPAPASAVLLDDELDRLSFL